MRILIIGGTAFSGPHIVKKLAENGHKTVLFHRGYTTFKFPKNVQQILGDRKHFHESKHKLRRFKPDLVLDMIALTEKDANDVLQIFRGIARRIVALSSQDVYLAYGKLIGIESGVPEACPITEDSPLRSRLYPYRKRMVKPDHPLYYYEKMQVEKVYMSDPEMVGTVLRLPMVYGPNDRQHRLFPYLKRMDDNRTAIVLEKELADWRWTKGYVADVAHAVCLAVTDETACGKIYNVGEPEALTEYKWVRAVARAAKWKGKIVRVPQDRLPESLITDLNVKQHLETDTSRIRSELKFSEQTPFQEAMRKTIKWERENRPEIFDPNMFDYAAEDEILKRNK